MERKGWFKSTASACSGNCVEVCFEEAGVAVRDSKNPAGAVLHFTRGEWTAFLDGAGKGEFDLT